MIFLLGSQERQLIDFALIHVHDLDFIELLFMKFLDYVWVLHNLWIIWKNTSITELEYVPAYYSDFWALFERAEFSSLGPWSCSFILKP